MFFYDPSYMAVMLVGMVLVFIPQMWVKKTYKTYDEIPTARGLTGAEVAEALLRENGVHDVHVEAVPGELSDHYDPGDKKVRLSEANYYGRSISAVTIAAHEVGHAIQHATGYYPVILRSAMVPAVNLGSQMGPIMLMIALGLGATGHIMPDWAWALAWIGVLLFSAAVAFHIVTLPVEINASMRAMRVLAGSNYLMQDELPGAKKVLTAAAMTYVAAAMYSLIQLIYFVMRLLNSRRD